MGYLLFISTILQSVRKENLAHYFPYDVKPGLLAHSRSFLANQKARNAIVGAENLLIKIIQIYELYDYANKIQLEQTLSYSTNCSIFRAKKLQTKGTKKKQ